MYCDSQMPSEDKRDRAHVVIDNDADLVTDCEDADCDGMPGPGGGTCELGVERNDGAIGAQRRRQLEAVRGGRDSLRIQGTGLTQANRFISTRRRKQGPKPSEETWFRHLC